MSQSLHKSKPSTPLSTLVVPSDSTSHLTPSLTLASPNFLYRAPIQTPGHFRSLPHSTNMFFGALPRILWHTPMPTPNLLPRLTQIQRTARGSEGGGGYNRIVTMQSWCNGLSKRKKERGEGEEERASPPALFYV